MEFRARLPLESTVAPHVDAIRPCGISLFPEIFATRKILCDSCNVNWAVVLVEAICSKAKENTIAFGCGSNPGFADCERQNIAAHAWRSTVIHSEFVNEDLPHLCL